MQLAAMAPTLLACGGRASPEGVAQPEVNAAVDADVRETEAHAAVDADVRETEAYAAVDADVDQTNPNAAICQVTTTTPVLTGGSSCGPEAIFSFNGTTEQCALADGGLDCPKLCPDPPSFATEYNASTATSCWVASSPSDLYCFYGACSTGRRPEGLELSVATPVGALSGHLLAVMAQLEAASVYAFRHLAHELRMHGAPAELQARALLASRDEERHARVVTKLARRRGARVAKVGDRHRGVRALEDIAIENAVEGCVRETFGAAVAMVQARTARDVAVRGAFARIALDETRHAELAWAVAGWLDTRLTPDAQARVRRARAQAADAMVEATSRGTDSEAMGNLGIPAPAHARALACKLRGSLWS
jgi:hypothetical protein